VPPIHLQNHLQQGVAQLSLDLDTGQISQLLDFLGLLEKWNRAYNLTAVDSPADMVNRHLLDSLAPAPYLHGDSLLDIGSGAGLPGIPLAIAFPGMQVMMLDSAGKKVRFINHVIRELALPNAGTRHCRIEAYQPRVCPDTITARAVAALPKIVGWCDQLMGPDTRLLAMKGRYPEQELLALPAGFMIDKVVALDVPFDASERHLAIVRREVRQDT